MSDPMSSLQSLKNVCMYAPTKGKKKPEENSMNPIDWKRKK